MYYRAASKKLPVQKLNAQQSCMGNEGKSIIKKYNYNLNILTANIRLKRNKRYLTQAIPPDTILTA